MRTVCGSADTVACHLAGGTHHAFRGTDIIRSCNAAFYPSLLNVGAAQRMCGIRGGG